MSNFQGNYMQQERRKFERIPVNMNIRLFSEQLPYNATMIDCSKNGIGMNTFYNCLPCRNKVTLLIPLDKEILRHNYKLVGLKVSNNAILLKS